MIARLTTAEAAEISRRHPDTIVKLLQLGTIHGTQDRPGATWRIREDCLEAYLDGRPCPHS